MEDVQFGPRIRKSVVLVEVRDSVGPGVFHGDWSSCVGLVLFVEGEYLRS